MAGTKIDPKSPEKATPKKAAPQKAKKYDEAFAVVKDFMSNFDKRAAAKLAAILGLLFVMAMPAYAGRRYWRPFSNDFGDTPKITGVESTGASTLTITDITASGDVTVTGTVTASGLLDSDTTGVTGDFVVTSNLTVTGTVAVVGIATFTAESVHNGGIDADYITTDGGAAGGLDTKTGATLTIGEATATKVEIGDTAVTTEVQGPLTVLGSTGAGLDAIGATQLFVGEANATQVSLGASDIDVDVLGGFNVLGTTTDGIDTIGATALYIGEETATSVVLGASDAPASILGGLTMKYEAKTASYTLDADDFAIVCDTTTVACTNTLPEASTVLGKVYVLTFGTDNAKDMLVVTDGTDKFDGTNDIITFADAGDSCIVMAVGNNIWALLSNIGGTLSN